MSRPEDWLSTEDAAREIGGVSARWVRKQVETGRLRARVLLTGRRATFRIRRDDLDRFRSCYILEDAREREP